MPDREHKVLDCVIISDLHLGSADCNIDELSQFLGWALRHTRILVLNGDVLDGLNLNQMTAAHADCIRQLRDCREHCSVVWVRGNHDGDCEPLSDVLNLPVCEQYVYQHEDFRLLCVHGDQFDGFVSGWLALVSCVFSWLFRLAQRWLPATVTRWLRSLSKHLQRNDAQIRCQALEYRRQHRVDAIACGHTHVPEQAGQRYYNTGTWAEYPPYHFVAVRRDAAALFQWQPQFKTARSQPTDPVCDLAALVLDGA